MIRVLDLYNFGDESIVSNPMFHSILTTIPVFSRLGVNQ